MKVLAFDTSSQALSVAILEDEHLLAELTLTVKKNHSVSLMPSIDFLMQQVGLSPKDLDRIVVAQGPGSYTGLRVAVATAKTLAYSLKIDLVGVSSLKVLALSSHKEGLVIPLIDARRRHVYAGFYENERNYHPDGYYDLDEVLALAKASQRQVIFVGEVELFLEDIATACPDARVFSVYPSAFELAKSGLVASPTPEVALLPNYLKRVEAEENWLQSHPETQGDYIKRV